MTRNGQNKNSPRRLSLSALRKQGVKVEHVKSTIALNERETSITYNEADDTAEVAAFNSRWMAKTESLGYIPREVYVCQGRGQHGAELRICVVPKSILRLPAAKRKLQGRALESARESLRRGRVAQSKSKGSQ